MSFIHIGNTPEGVDPFISAMPMAQPISAVRPVFWGGMCGGGNAVLWTIGGGGITIGGGFLQGPIVSSKRCPIHCRTLSSSHVTHSISIPTMLDVFFFLLLL
jgi:hypothetical protein